MFRLSLKIVVLLGLLVGNYATPHHSYLEIIPLLGVALVAGSIANDLYDLYKLRKRR